MLKEKCNKIECHNLITLGFRDFNIQLFIIYSNIKALFFLLDTKTMRKCKTYCCIPSCYTVNFHITSQMTKGRLHDSCRHVFTSHS